MVTNFVGRGSTRSGQLRNTPYMTAFLMHKHGVFLYLIACVLIASCSGPEVDIQDDYILKTNIVTITGNDFSEELDLKKAAYPYNIKDTPEAYNQMVIHLVKMLTEEIILLHVAGELGLAVSDSELEQAVTEFKKDYPEDSFDQIMLKNAISYPFWLQRFRKHMLIDKLVNQELKKKVRITPEDILTFYKEHQKSGSTNPEDTTVINQIQNEKELVARLRMHKTQIKYEEWIQQLSATYPVTINNKKLKEFLMDSKKDKVSENED